MMRKTGERLISSRPAEAPEDAARAPLRVLIVGPSMGILGGQAVQAARLLTRLGQEPQLEVSFLPINPQLPGILRWLQKVKYLRTVVTSLVYGATLLARVRKYDCVHIFSAAYFSFVLAPTPAILISKLYGKKSILNYRSGECEDHFTRWRRTATRTARLVDVVAVPSGYLVDVFKRFGISARPIFNFVEIERFRFRERRPLRPVFLSNRNHEPLYNVGCVLRAFALIQRRFPEASLTVAGDGSQRASLERLASELGLRRTSFIGRVEPEKMPELYDAADIYLNSPNIDNMPGSIIEAFAAGLPVVTTDAGGIPYILSDGETGMMVGRDDHEAMADRAIRLLEDQALARAIVTNAHEECRKYSWDSVRHEWLGLYYSLAGRDQASLRNEQATCAAAPVSEH